MYSDKSWMEIHACQSKTIWFILKVKFRAFPYQNISLLITKTSINSTACVDIWLHMEIKWFLFNDSNRVQHNKLFLQQLQVNFINWSFSFLGKINILSITNPANTCWKTVSTMKQIFCQTKDQTHLYFMIMHTNCNWFLCYND